MTNTKDHTATDHSFPKKRWRPSRKVFIVTCTLVCVVIVGFVLFSPVISNFVENVKERVAREIRNEHLWTYSEDLKKKLSQEEYSQLSYIVVMGQLSISGTLSSDEAFDSLLQAVFSGPDELVYNVSIEVEIEGKANLSLRAPAEGPSASESYWTLSRRSYVYSTKHQANPDPRHPDKLATGETEIRYDRDGHPIDE